jgi:hypothetical protein
MLKIALVVSLLILSIGCNREGLELIAGPDQRAGAEIPNFRIPGRASFALSLDKPRPHPKWAPYVSYQLYQGDGSDSFRLSLYQPRPDKKVEALVEYYKDGVAVVRSVRISEIPLGALVYFELAWDLDGRIRYKVMGGTWEEMRTHLRDFRAQVESSNAEATYYPHAA